MKTRFPTSIARRTKRAFTLIELIVVIFIIVVLAAIIGGSLYFFNSGKDLELTGNAVDAYLSELRSKAGTSGNEIVVVCFPRRPEDFDLADDEKAGYPIVALDENGDRINGLTISSGFVAFEKRKLSELDIERGETPEPEQVYRYLGTDFNFDRELREEVVLHQKKLEDWTENRKVIETVLPNQFKDFEALGIIPEGQDSYFLMIIYPDGRVFIPRNIPVTKIDARDDEINERDADIVFTNGSDALYIDISNYMKITDRFYKAEVNTGTKYEQSE